MRNERTLARHLAVGAALCLAACAASGAERADTAACQRGPASKAVANIDIDALCPPRPETAAKFAPGTYPPAARPYRESARMIYEYMTGLPGMTALVETGKPNQKYQHNAYVSKTHAAHIRAMLRWAKLDPAKREKAMRFAKASAEYLLGELEPADAPLAFWPPTYGRKPLEFDPKTDGPYEKPSMKGNEPEGAVKYRGEVMLLYPADVGTAFVAYYEETKDGRFLAAAKGIAGTYLKTRRADGSWPLKMKLATGETVGENTLVPTRVLAFFEKLHAATGEARWRTEADRVFAWLDEHPLKDWNWDGQFEDIRPEKPYRNPTKHNACETLLYMLDRFPGDKARLALCRRLLEFCEKRFVVWQTPANRPGWPAPSVLEQYSCFTPIDASAAKMIRTYAAMYRAEGRPEDLQKARALADTITRMQQPSGRVPTFWDANCGLTGERYDWLNCMAAAAEALVVADEADAPGTAGGAEIVRETVAPTRIVWTSGPSVSRAENLLAKKRGQVPEAGWDWGRMQDGCCVMTNGGAAAALVLDFGRELHGGLRLAVSAQSSRDMRVRVRFGESVGEAMSELGERGACNDHAIRDSEILLPFMGTREIGNTGFRFVRLDLVTPGQLALEAVSAVSLMRPMKPVGAFRCSDERLNRIFDTAVRTAHLCCQDYLWDGIKRDRLVWMGDMHPETMTTLAVFGAAEVIPETLDLVAATTPADGWANGFPTYTLCWIRNFAAWYRFTGDKAYLRRHAAYLAAVFAHVRTALPGGVWRKDGDFGAFLDWPTHGNPEAELAGAQALALIAVEDVRFLADALGDGAWVREADDLLAKMRAARPDPHGAKSAAALLALAGLRDPQEMLADCLLKKGHADVSTFYGYYMLEAMSAAGAGQRALDTVRDYWGAMLDMGATSFWEDFDLAWTNGCFRIDELPVAGKKDIHGDFGAYCYKGFRHSLCHGWSSGPAAWCVNRVLGIRPLDVGCKTVEVRPFLGDLEWAEGAMALPDGRAVRVRAEKKQDGTTGVSVSAPDGVTVRQGS